MKKGHGDCVMMFRSTCVGDTNGMYVLTHTKGYSSPRAASMTRARWLTLALCTTMRCSVTSAEKSCSDSDSDTHTRHVEPLR
jgi:hypothetical protein